MRQAKVRIYSGKHQLTEAKPMQKRIARILKTTTAETLPFEDRYVDKHDELVQILTAMRDMGCVIVFMTGVWDLFHIGHGDYIEKGKAEARKIFPDAEYIIMVVGIDTDELTRERKGDNRPIVPLDERARVLRHQRPVDIITPQYELNELYAIVKPDVQIVSTSTKDLPPGMEIVCEHCTHLISLPPQAETSTSARIRRLMLDGATKVLNRATEVLDEASAKIRSIRNEL